MDSKNDIAVVPYSSGTTGLPKGVMLTYYNIVAPELKGITSGDTVMSILQFFHMYGMVIVLFQGLYIGVKQIDHSFLAAIQEYLISCASLVPPLVPFLAKHPDVSKYNVSSLNIFVCGAARLRS